MNLGVSSEKYESQDSLHLLGQLERKRWRMDLDLSILALLVENWVESCLKKWWTTLTQLVDRLKLSTLCNFSEAMYQIMSRMKLVYISMCRRGYLVDLLGLNGEGISGKLWFKPAAPAIGAQMIGDAIPSVSVSLVTSWGSSSSAIFKLKIALYLIMCTRVNPRNVPEISQIWVFITSSVIIKHCNWKAYTQWEDISSLPVKDSFRSRSRYNYEPVVNIQAVRARDAK